MGDGDKLEGTPLASAMKRNKAGVAIPGRRAGVVGKGPRSEGVVKGWGPQSKTGGFQLQKGCWLPSQGSVRGWELQAGGSVQGHKPGTEGAVTR